MSVLLRDDPCAARSPALRDSDVQSKGTPTVLGRTGVRASVRAISDLDPPRPPPPRPSAHCTPIVVWRPLSTTLAQGSTTLS